MSDERRISGIEHATNHRAGALDIARFISEGYNLIPRADLRHHADPATAERFVEEIADMRAKLRAFFERPLHEKAAFEIGHDRDPATNCYYAGWWRRQSTFAGIDYPLEYYVSRSFSASTATNFCQPSNDSEATREIAATLPHRAMFSFATFLHHRFVTPLLQQYARAASVPAPSPTLQIQTTYYESRADLARHTDRSFLEGIIGPATGLTIFPGDGTRKSALSLETGDVLLYTGRQFHKYFQFHGALQIPPPLPHAVTAEPSRMSLLLACWMPGFE